MECTKCKSHNETCQHGQFQNDNGTCVSCDMADTDGCEVCMNATMCQSCYPGYVMDSSMRCMPDTGNTLPCPGGFYRATGGECMQCVKGCKRCNSTSCLECFSGEWNQDQTTCGMNCRLSCSAGSNGCYMCDAMNETCIACMNGYTYDAKNFACMVNSGVACKTPGPEYPHYFFMAANDTCAECDQGVHCMQCETSSSNCVKCDGNYTLNATSGMCQPTTPSARSLAEMTVRTLFEFLN